MKSLIVLLLASVVLCKPTIYLIRHGEKPEDDDIPGLSPQGKQRAQCLRNVFSRSSSYNIGYIMAQDYKKDGSRRRPYDTVLPLATDLGITVDHSCDRDDSECVADSVKDYKGSGNILICWQHGQMNNIVEELGAKDISNYPEERFDLIWTIPPPYKDVTNAEISNAGSQNCPGLDVKRII